MKFSIVINPTEKQGENGYPVVARVSLKQKRVKKVICHAWPHEFSAEAQTVLENHPFYDELGPMMMHLKIRAKKMVLERRILDPKVFMEELLRNHASGITMAEFGAEWLAEQQQLLAAYEKRKDIAQRNKTAGYIKTVNNALVQFNTVIPHAPVAHLDYNTLMRFRKQQQLAGNAPTTISLYLRTMRMLYNKACLPHRIPNEKPFAGVLDGLKTKSYQSKKKHLDKDTVRLLEGLNLTAMQEARARDLFLLQFYFGGADLIDVYFLKKFQVKKGRVRFERGKVNTGVVIDLPIHPKAQAILDRYPGSDEWQFPWRKDVKGYEGFRRKVQRMLVVIQQRQATLAEQSRNEALRIDVQPGGGALGIKVARHTFGNIAKQEGIDQDVIRELMGHQRDDVDNYYKDKYPEAVRDAALFTIIGL